MIDTVTVGAATDEVRAAGVAGAGTAGAEHAAGKMMQVTKINEIR
jgi:hypothetical protein